MRRRASNGVLERLVTWARLSFAMQRWELLLVTAGTALLAGVMLWIAWQAHVLVAANPACFTGDSGGSCQVLGEQFSNLAAFSRQVILASFAAPFGIGLVVGVPIVAREIDHGTAGLAWTLSRSRTRWLLPRVVFAVLVVIGLLAVLAISSDVMAQAVMPGSNMSADFAWYGRRGGLLVMRGLLALGIGLVFGAILGRQLPALLVATFVSIAIFTGVSLGMDKWLEAQAVPEPYGVETVGSLRIDARIQLTNGDLVDWAEMSRRGLGDVATNPDGLIATIDGNGVMSPPIGRLLIMSVPGDRYPIVVLQESAVLAMLVLVVGGVAFLVVRRRRPH